MANQQLHTNENGSHRKPPEKCPEFKTAMAACFSSYDTKFTNSYSL
jgi:hypothetical protein